MAEKGLALSNGTPHLDLMRLVLRRAASLGMVLALAGEPRGGAVFAQSAASPAPAAAAAQPPAKDIIQVSPLVVVADQDDGFVAATSLAGGRLSTALRDTPVAYSVITRDLLDALNLSDTESALAWAVGAYAPQTSTLNYKFFNFEGGSSVMSRGIQTNAPQRNFFLLGLNSDTYSQERIDFARGPNALLIGTSGLGGVVNGMTKQARVDRPFSSLTIGGGSWNRFRTTADINRGIRGTAAIRVNALWQDIDSWRDMGFDRRRGAHLALTFKPLPNTQVRAEYEYYRQELLLGLDSINDRVSGWDGSSVVPAPTATIAASDAKGLARNGSNTAPYPVYVPGSDPGRVMNWANTWTTVGGAATASVPVGGVLPLSTVNLGINGGAIGGSVYDSAQLFRLAEAGSHFRAPGRRTVIAPNAPTIRYCFQNAAVFLEHRQGAHLFFETAISGTAANHLTEYIETAGLADVRIDVNETLPDGRPNPNFKQPYGEAMNGHTHFDDRIGEARAAAALVFDQIRWGDFRANVILGGRRVKSYTRQLAPVLNRNADLRQRALQDTFYYRYYWNDPGKPFVQPKRVAYIDPINGTASDHDVNAIADLSRPGNQRLADSRFGYLQAALNARLLKGRVNLIAGARRDNFRGDTYTLHGDPNVVASDYPANWNGQAIIYRPAAPADYWGLTYTPKDAAGAATGPAQPALTRPRVRGVPQPQYANDRFQDDYSSPRVSFNVNTVTYGGVWHVFKWLSAYANYAESFNPPISGLMLSGSSVPPGLSEGWDAGVRANFLNGRVNASVGKYGSTQRNNSFDSTGSTRKYADLASANPVGDFTVGGSNRRGLGQIPIPTFDFRDRKANGYEIDVVANPTVSWRLMFNAAWPKVHTTHNASDEWAYLRANETTLRQIAIDAGAVIDANNVASVDLSIPVSNRSPDVAAAVAAWNNIQTFKATNNPAAIAPTNLPDYTANFYSDYRFRSEGLLKGVRFGAGVQYIGKRIIGNRGADTIVDPANPARAVDDPDVDAATPVYRGSYHTVTASLGYAWKLSRRSTVTLNLTITNLLDEDRLIFTGTGLRPPNGDIGKPNRVTVPTGFVYLQPRAYSLSATIDF